MPTIVDACIILILGIGAIVGFKRGVIQSAAQFLGTLAVIIIAYYLKNPVSEFFYTYLPFFNFSGALEGVTVLNIIIYEAIAYIVIILLLWAILRVIIVITGLLELILKMTVVLSIPSKLLGIIFGLAEAYIVLFVILFCANQIFMANNQKIDSKYASVILNNTPLLSEKVSNAYNSVDEVVSMASKYQDAEDKNEYNKEALDILLKNKFITVDAATKLIEKEKLEITGAEEILNKYKGE